MIWVVCLADSASAASLISPARFPAAARILSVSCFDSARIVSASFLPFSLISSTTASSPIVCPDLEQQQETDDQSENDNCFRNDRKEQDKPENILVLCSRTDCGRTNRHFGDTRSDSG